MTDIQAPLFLEDQNEIICIGYECPGLWSTSERKGKVHMYWEGKRHGVFYPTHEEIAELCEFVNNTVGCFSAQPLGWLWHRYQRPPGPDEFWRYTPD